MNKWQKKSLVLALTTGMMLTSLGVAFGEEAKDETPGFELDQVVVTATKTAKKIKDVPVVVQVITREEMDKKNVQNVADAIKGVSGISVRNISLANDTTVIMRGFKSKGILVLIDGQSQNDGYASQITWSQIPIENIERIEVVKGPGSSLYGSNAQAGVINIITKSKAVNQTEVKLGTGGHGMERKTLSHSGSTGKLDYFLDYSKITYDGFETAYPTDTKNYRGHQGGEREQYTGKLVYHIDENNKFSFNAYRGNSSYKYELGTDQADKVSKGINLDYQSKVNDTFNYQFTWGEKKTDNWYYTGWSKTAKKQSLMHQLNYFKTNDGDIHANWQINPKDLFTFGYSLRKEQGTACDERELTQFYPGHTWSFVKSWDQIDRKSGGKTTSDSFYFQDEHKFDDKFTTFVGGRYTNWKTTDGWNSFRRTSASDPIYSEYPDREESNFSSRIGMVYKGDTKTTWKFNVGQGFRTPTFYELYRSSQTNISEITTSNINLKPEKSTSYDLNVDYQIDSSATLSASYFYNQLTDAITTMTYAVTGGYVPNIGYIPGVTKEYRQSNADKAVMKGFEVGLNKRLSDKWTTYVNYTYTDAQIKESKNPAAIIGEQMNDIPKTMLNFGIDYNADKWAGSLNGRRSSDPRNDDTKGVYNSYDPFFVVDMKLSYAPDKNSKISLSIDNLFDRHYFASYLCATRNAFLEYSYKF